MLDYINPAGLKLVGLGSLEEAAALHLLDFVVSEMRPRVRDEFWPVVARVGRWVGEISVQAFQERYDDSVPRRLVSH